MKNLLAAMLAVSGVFLVFMWAQLESSRHTPDIKAPEQLSPVPVDTVEVLQDSSKTLSVVWEVGLDKTNWFRLDPTPTTEIYAPYVRKKIHSESWQTYIYNTPKPTRVK